MKKLLKNTISLAAFLILSTIALPAFALEVSLPEGNAEEILIVPRSDRYRRYGRYRPNRIRCLTVGRTRRGLYQRCWRSICFRRGIRGRVRCRVLKTWRRRIPYRYRSRRFWRRWEREREIPRRYKSRRIRIYDFSD